MVSVCRIIVTDLCPRLRAQLCLHSRDVYFTTKILLYGSLALNVSRLLFSSLKCDSICNFTAAVLLAFTVSILLFCSLRLFYFYCSPHFGCFTATVHLALIKQTWKNEQWLQPLDDHSCTLLNAKCPNPTSQPSLTYARDCVRNSHFTLQLCTNHRGMSDWMTHGGKPEATIAVHF